MDNSKVQKLYEKVLAKMRKLMENEELDKARVTINHNNYLSIEAVRAYPKDIVMCYEVYLVRKGQDFDCCTVDTMTDESIYRFVQMYA